MRIVLVICISFICFTTQAQKDVIYFTSGKAKNRSQKNIGVIDPNGKAYKEVTFSVSSRSEYQPHVSKDGRFMTFNTYRYGGWKVVIADSDGKNVRKLTKSNNYEYDASWSPNGSIVLIGFENGNSGKRQLYLVTPSTGKKVVLTDGKDAYYSPYFINENEIVYSKNKAGHYGIYKMDVRTKKQHVLVDDSKYHEISPKVSPKGKYLAYHRVNENRNVEMVVYDFSSEKSRVIYSGWIGKERLSKMQTPLFPFSIGWSPNSEQLVFTSLLAPGNYELIRIDRNGENKKQLTFNPWSDIQPHWAN